MPVRLAFSVPINAGPQPIAPSTSPSPAGLQLRVALLSGAPADCSGCGSVYDCDRCGVGILLVDGATLPWAPEHRLEVATDAWLWEDSDGGLEYVFFYDHLGAWLPIQTFEGDGLWSLWTAMRADPWHMRRRLPLPLLHPQEAVLRFGVVVRDGDAAEYWHWGSTIRVVGPGTGPPAPASAPGPATVAPSPSLPLPAMSSDPREAVWACRATTSPPYSWHMLFAAATAAIHWPGPAPCRLASASATPLPVASHVLAAVRNLSAASSDPASLRHVYPAVALAAVRSAANASNATLQGVLESVQQRLQTGWLPPPVAGLYLALLQRILDYALAAPGRSLALHCIALLHGAVVHGAGIGVEVGLTTHPGAPRSRGLASRTRRTVPCASAPQHLPLGPAWARVPALDMDMGYDLRLTYYPTDVHGMPAPLPVESVLSLRWASVEGLAGGSSADGAGSLPPTATSRLEYCLRAPGPGSGVPTCATLGAGAATAWQVAGPPRPRQWNATVLGPPPPNLPTAEPLRCCRASAAADFAIVFVPTPTPTPTPTSTPTLTLTHNNTHALAATPSWLVPTVVALVFSHLLCFLLGLSAACGLLRWCRRRRPASPAPPKDLLDNGMAVGPQDASPSELPRLGCTPNPLLPPRTLTDPLPHRADGVADEADGHQAVPHERGPPPAQRQTEAPRGLQSPARTASPFFSYHPAAQPSPSYGAEGGASMCLVSGVWDEGVKVMDSGLQPLSSPGAQGLRSGRRPSTTPEPRSRDPRPLDGGWADRSALSLLPLTHMPLAQWGSGGPHDSPAPESASPNQWSFEVSPRIHGSLSASERRSSDPRRLQVPDPTQDSAAEPSHVPAEAARATAERRPVSGRAREPRPMSPRHGGRAAVAETAKPPVTPECNDHEDVMWKGAGMSPQWKRWRAVADSRRTPTPTWRSWRRGWSAWSDESPPEGQ